jgi:hypothetical protein
VCVCLSIYVIVLLLVAKGLQGCSVLEGLVICGQRCLDGLWMKV